MTDRIFGLTWDQIQAAQQGREYRKKIDTTKPGDYGSDPLGDGKFRMVPSGDVVDYDEMRRRLDKR